MQWKKKTWLATLILLFSVSALAAAQQFQPDGAEPVSPVATTNDSAPVLTAPVALPRMAPELALATYERRLKEQADTLAAYSDTTIIDAELPDTSQKGVYELKRRYLAPRTLEYTPVHFEGDGFVKSNVIVRLLQADVSHVSNQEGPQTAVDQRNYKFKLKGADELDGHPCWMYEVKPRQKRAGLFKGRIFIDVHTGALRRAEGSIPKSPSWWVRRVSFVQDYDEIGGYFLPVRLHTLSQARVIGWAIVNIEHRDYRPARADELTAYGGGDGKN